MRFSKDTIASILSNEDPLGLDFPIFISLGYDDLCAERPEIESKAIHQMLAGRASLSNVMKR